MRKKRAADEKKMKQLTEQKPEVAMKSFVNLLIDERLKHKSKGDEDSADDVDMNGPERSLEETAAAAVRALAKNGARPGGPKGHRGTAGTKAAAAASSSSSSANDGLRTQPNGAKMYDLSRPDGKWTAHAGLKNWRKNWRARQPTPDTEAETEGPLPKGAAEEKEGRARARAAPRVADVRRAPSCMAEFAGVGQTSPGHEVRPRLALPVPRRHPLAGPLPAV